MTGFDVYALHLGDHDYRYVGVTTLSAASRLKIHRRNAFKQERQSKLYSWMRKHQFDGIVTEVLETVETKDELYAAEIKWIAIFRAEGRDLLNMVDGGLGSIGYKFPPERLEQHGKWNIGRKMDPEAVARSAQARTGAKRSDEAKAKMRAAKAGKAQKPEHAEASRRHLKSLRNDPEYQERIREQRAGKAYREAMSEGARTRWSNPDYAARHNAVRRKCLDCGMITKPGPMGLHLKTSGHRGFVTAS